MSESEQIEKVREALAADPDTAPCVDQIMIQPGDPWYIGGRVDSIAARRKAVWVARRVLPEVDHEDAVTLVPEVSKPDQELAAQLLAQLHAEPVLQGVHIIEPGSHPPPLDQPWIGVMARQGVIYLGGRVQDLTAKAVAEGLAWETRACSDV